MAKDEKLEKRGLFLGRFQPFHLGHLEVIKQALKMVDELVIVIGSAQYSHTFENPFTDSEREEMIENSLKALNLTHYMVVPVEDIDDDSKYVKHVEKYVPAIHLVFAATNKLTEKLFSARGYKIWTCDRYKGIESKKIREMMLEDNPAWRTMVPKQVMEAIEEIDGIGRIKNVHQLL
ncbi:nicotinamide-nucleotide adenylyltransferase [Candidatus Woesearchaeota archaeon]|nr:nicotinamide-nucleotide adenylyltransferase [Candidatus Woesearchaeota archaeon]